MLEGVNKKGIIHCFLLGIDGVNRFSGYKVVSNSSQICVFRY
ncbi:hypothetical protein PROSTU_00125 [Providencia stuartii ATCC 25827]|uniref:Uncharacterized protein n=1 Tax=Providencia stuartii ATCC 25827 TaxID=471874 RepID=A0AA86YGD1_PROST|nr:hypothetical protein PROSTU_04486 [Providencia stuartii ATCC 25827]EDU61856.1 hypothetical protein PROSTU_00125 [Providencia stuartii ATCC 25827]